MHHTTRHLGNLFAIIRQCPLYFASGVGHSRGSDHLLGGSDWNHHSEATGMGRDHWHYSPFRIRHLLTKIICDACGRAAIHTSYPGLPSSSVHPHRQPHHDASWNYRLLYHALRPPLQILAKRQLKGRLRSTNFRRMPLHCSLERFCVAC